MLKGFHIAAGKIATSDGKVGQSLEFLLNNAAPLNGMYHLNYAVANLCKIMGLSPVECKAFLQGKYKYRGKPMYLFSKHPTASAH